MATAGAPLARSPGPRILVAEDDDEMRELLAKTLEHAGYQVVQLEDGAELSDYLELINARSTRASQPDLVLTDVRMPGKSGLDVVRQARQVGLNCPVVVLSGFADELRLEAPGLGDTVLLSKPIEVDALLEVVRRLLSPGQAALGTRVLVVEASFELRQLLRRALQQRGCIVEEVTDSEALTARLRADRGERPPPDLVIADVHSPRSGEPDVLAPLEGSGRKPRLIVMNALGDPTVRTRAVQLGAEEVFDRPFEIDALADAAVRAARRKTH